MNSVEIIARKRDGRELSRAEIAYFMQGYCAGQIPNYQMAALAMAIYLKGMTARETADLALEMQKSGQSLAWTSAGAVHRNADDSLRVDALPRLERSVSVAGGDEERVVSATSTISLDEDSELSGIDARDTVDLGEDSFVPATLLLDGTSNPLHESGRGGRDTVELDVANPGIRISVSPGAVVDKHSTGGLGDKTSLILAPLLACCGLRVPMISGRGLGAASGTLDKLDSIPGCRTDFPFDEIREMTERVGCVITGPTAELAPAERKLYSLRDVTATVTSIPLMVASILSKKLAEGIDAIAFDVKWGNGAQMKTLPSARKLAESLVETSHLCGVKAVALLTNMDQPLGRMIGHALEIDEVLDVLTGKGPADLWTVTSELGAELLVMAGGASTLDDARQILNDHVMSGRAEIKFREMIAAQGGNLDQPRLRTGFHFEIRAIRSGFVGKINTETLELALMELGCGRRVLSDSIDHSVGLEMLVRIGDRVQVGQSLVRVHCRVDQADSVKPLLRTAISIREKTLDSPVLIAERVV